MFKNIGIYIKEKSGEGIDSHGLDVLINNLKKHTPKNRRGYFLRHEVEEWLLKNL